MRLSDKWEDQISLILRFLDWKKQIKKKFSKKVNYVWNSWIYRTE